MKYTGRYWRKGTVQNPPNSGPMTKLFAHPMWDKIPAGGLRRSLVHHGPRRKIALAIADVWDSGIREFQTREIAETCELSVRTVGTCILRELRHHINLERIRYRNNYSELPKSGWRFIRENR